MRTLIILIFVSNFSFSQHWNGKKINESDLSPWLEKFAVKYAGNYRFGENENESNLRLFFTKDCIIGQIKINYIDNNSEIIKSKYINLTNIKIDKKGQFTSDQYTGKFLKFKTKTSEVYKGLKIKTSDINWIKYNKFEIGTRTEILFEDIYSGKYKEVSYRKLTDYDCRQVKYSGVFPIMRNEIYARYGYVFINDEKMDKYFRNQDWYKAEHKDVSRFLTEIELHNIKMIKLYE